MIKEINGNTFISVDGSKRFVSMLSFEDIEQKDYFQVVSYIESLRLSINSLKHNETAKIYSIDNKAYFDYSHDEDIFKNKNTSHDDIDLNVLIGGKNVYSDPLFKDDYLKINGSYIRFVSVSFQEDHQLDIAQLQKYGDYFICFQKIKTMFSKMMINEARKMSHSSLYQLLSDIEGIEAYKDNENMLKMIISGQEELFKVDAHYIVKASTEEELKLNTDLLIESLDICGFSPRIETVALNHVFKNYIFGMKPKLQKSLLFHTSLLANSLPSHSDKLMSEGMTLNARSGIELKFDSRNSDSYSVVVTGRTGNGKTVFVNFSFLEKSYFRDRFEIFSNVFGFRFIDVSIEGKNVFLYRDLLPASLDFSSCPQLAPNTAWMGQNQFGKDIFVDFQKTPAIYVDGRPGAGKTVAILSLVEGYLRSHTTNTTLVVVSTKPADYYGLKGRENLDLKLIDPFDGNFDLKISEILENFNSIKTREVAFKDFVSQNNVSTADMNMNSLWDKGHFLEFSRLFFVFDEAKDYLSKDKADSKEIAEAKNKLISAVYTHIRRTARFLSIPIVVGSQTQAESDLDIPLKAFHLRLASSTNEAMSRLICGDSRLTDLSFTRGKYFIKTDSDENIVRIPMI